MNLKQWAIPMRSWTRPGAADLDINSRVVWAERHVHAHVNPIFPGDFVTEADAACRNRLRAFEAIELIPCRAAANEAHEAEAFPELPAQFGLDLRNLFALIIPPARPFRFHV